jgi:hypothetical protein
MGDLPDETDSMPPRRTSHVRGSADPMGDHPKTSASASTNTEREYRTGFFRSTRFIDQACSFRAACAPINHRNLLFVLAMRGWISAAPSTHSEPISRTRWITARPGRRAEATPMPCAPHPPYPRAKKMFMVSRTRLAKRLAGGPCHCGRAKWRSREQCLAPRRSW